jgi:hypothetical protein
MNFKHTFHMYCSIWMKFDYFVMGVYEITFTHAPCSTALLVGGSRDRSPVVSLGIFFVASDGTMCPGVDSASKNEYQDTPEGKDDRCVRVTTLPPL